MPYALKEEGGKYYVINQNTGQKKSNKPKTRKAAVAYLRALYANTKD